jgi:hypothetical protein
VLDESGCGKLKSGGLWTLFCEHSKIETGPRPRYGRLARRALLRGPRARHLLSSNAGTAVVGSRASRSRPTSSRSQSKIVKMAATRCSHFAKPDKQRRQQDGISSKAISGILWSLLLPRSVDARKRGDASLVILGFWKQYHNSTTKF